MDAAAVPMLDGFPSVARFSSLLDYLELCDAAVVIKSATLDCDLLKRTDETWEGLDGSEPLSARAVVETMREYISEDDPDADLDKLCVLIEPVDKLAIKKEMADAADLSDDEPFMTVGMKLCEMEFDGERFVETKTFDDGPAAAQQHQQQPKIESYQLPLHLRLPTPAPAATPAPAEDSEAPAPVEAPAPAEAPAPVEAPAEQQHPLPEVGSYVTVGGDAGFVFRTSVKKGTFVIAYADETLEACGTNIPWEASPEAERCAIAAVIWVLQGKTLLVESYLYGKSVIGACGPFSMSTGIRGSASILKY